jgi:hypothetical protein
MAENARPHHMTMKYFLAHTAVQEPEQFFAWFGPGGDAAYLAKLWTSVGRSMPDEQRAGAEGLSAWYRPAGKGPERLVLTLPPPIARDEAYFVAAVRMAAGCRVFCLERAAMPTTSDECTVLWESTLEGRTNWGPGPAPVVAEFSERIDKLISDPSERPIAFVPMRLF